MSVDPGVRTAGVCLWEYESFCKVRSRAIEAPFPPEMALAVTYSGGKADDYIHQVEEVFERILEFVDNREVMEIWCEQPMIFASSAKGHAAASDVLHMMYFLGYLSRWGYEQGADFFPASVMKWKGNLPKQVVNDRIFKKLQGRTGALSLSFSHDWDACGVGLYGQGRF